MTKITINLIEKFARGKSYLSQASINLSPVSHNLGHLYNLGQVDYVICVDLSARGITVGFYMRYI